MGFIISLVVKLIKLFLYFVIFFALVVLIPNLPPYTNFTRIDLEPALPRDGALALNNALNNVQKLYEDKLLGPEAFQLYDGEVYTSLATGEIVKISPGGHVTFVTKIGQPCTGTIQEHICGRVLGFQIDEKNKQLYAADTYLGIWKVDLKTDKKQLLVSPRVEVDGCLPKLINNLILDKDGNLYYTVSSCDVQLKDGAYASFLDPSGRVLQYNAAKNESKVLLDKIWFPNGITISPDNNYLLIVETLSYKISKYYIRGPKKGQKETFISGLPGAPDNIRALPDGSGVLVALYTASDDHHPLLSRTLASVPHVRKFLARLQRLVEMSFEFLNDQYPHVVFEEIVYYIGSFKSMSALTPPISGLVQIDWAGNVVASYYNTDSSVKHISDAIVFKDMLFLGNPHVQNFIAGVPIPPQLKQAFTNKKIHNVKDEVKVTEKKETKPETPKPTTPMPKTTTPIPEIKTTTPKPIEIKTTTNPKPAETKPTPKPVEAKPTPKPVELKSTPKPVETKSTPKPVETKPTPKPVETKPTPKPESVKTTIKSEEKIKAPSKESSIPKQNDATLKDAKNARKPADQPKDVPKPADEKPTTAPKPTETKPVKHIEPDSTGPKPAETQSSSPPKPKTEQKESAIPPKPTPKQEPKIEPKQADSKPVETKSAPSQRSQSTSAPPKQTESKANSSPKQPENKPQKSEEKSKEAEAKPQQKDFSKPSSDLPPREQIPIKEEIPSDTAKPSKDKLKVIKKEGPTEIPNLNL